VKESILTETLSIISGLILAVIEDGFVLLYYVCTWEGEGHLALVLRPTRSSVYVSRHVCVINDEYKLFHCKRVLMSLISVETAKYAY
jgi:hypothetical protein